MTHHPGRIEIPARLRPTPIALIVHALLLGTPATATLGAAVWAPPALAQAEVAKRFDVPAGSLDDALNTLARQAGITLSFDPAVVAKGKTSPGLKGSYSVQAGFAALLAGTGLEAFRLADGSYGLRVAPVADRSAETQLAPVTVTEFERVYRQNATSSGLGMDADALDVPLTTVSIPMDILEDQQVNNVEDALRNVAGVTKFKQGNGGEEKFSIRGFDASQSLYKDGARINNTFNATNIATTETANIERYDVLKGPASILYGQGEPGGVINYVTKVPLFQNHRSVEVIVGSYDYKRAEVDLTGPINESLAYRLVASHQDSDDARDFVSRKRTLVAPSITLKVSPQTLLTAQYEYIDDKYTQDRGQVLDGNDATGLYYSSRLNNKQFFGVPGWNEKTNSKYQRYALLAEHYFDDGGALTVRYSRTEVDKELYDSSPRQTLQPDGSVLIRPGFQEGRGESESALVKYQREVAGGSVLGLALRHKLMAQVDYEHAENDGTARSVSPNAVTYNVLTGQYSGIPANGFTIAASGTPIRSEFRQQGLVLQDLISVGEKWNLLLGARHTQFKNEEANVTSHDTSPRVGVVYKAADTLSYYASWAKGFVPTTLTGFNPATGNGIGGRPVDPESTEQIELGLKALLADRQLEVTAAVFDLRKKDIAVTDPGSLALPAGEQWSINAGETRTRGFELQGVGKLSETFRLIGGYAYLDNELTKVDPALASQKGNRLPGIPKHSGNIWGVYEPAGGFLRGFGFGLGVFAQSKSYVSTENRAKYDGWTQLDAMAYYKGKGWKLQLNAKNLTNEEYNLAQAGTTTDSFGGMRVGTSSPRTFNLSFSALF